MCRRSSWRVRYWYSWVVLALQNGYRAPQGAECAAKAAGGCAVSSGCSAVVVAGDAGHHKEQ